MIPERERKALMRLTMCARVQCDICKYRDSTLEECDERITQNMNILADALEDLNHIDQRKGANDEESI